MFVLKFSLNNKTKQSNNRPEFMNKLTENRLNLLWIYSFVFTLFHATKLINAHNSPFVKL